MPEVGSVIGGKYRVDVTLGMGGMGAVYGVTHEITGKQFAIKWLLPELVESEEAAQRFLREAQIAGGIEHPNVLSIFDVGKEDDAPYIVMERLNGEPLGSRLERGAMSPAEACSVLMSVASGVAAAHAHGIIHRDLKPDNIFLAVEPHTGTVRPKVLDFGISKPKKDHPTLEGNLTTTGIVVGTPRYMSPEHVRGSKDVDHRTDIYALGVILYEMLTLRAPFESDTYGDLVLRIATETPEPITAHDPKLPHALNDVIMKAMARDPAARFPTAEDFAAALSPWAQGTQAEVNSAFAPTAAFPTPPGLQRTKGGEADASPPGTGPTGTEPKPAATPTSWEQPLPIRRSLLTIGSLAGTAIVATAAFAIWVFLIREDPGEATQGASMASATSGAQASDEAAASPSDTAPEGVAQGADTPTPASAHDAGTRHAQADESEELPRGAPTPEAEAHAPRRSEADREARSRRRRARKRAEAEQRRRAKRRSQARSSRASSGRRSDPAPEGASQDDRAPQKNHEEESDIRHRAGELSLDDF